MLGGFAYTLVPKKLNPELSGRSVSVYCSWSGAPAAAVEAQVTAHLEGALNRVKGVKAINSWSNVGSCGVTVDFVNGLDMEFVRFEIAGILRNLYPKLPSGAGYPQLQVSGGNESQGPFMSYTLITGLDGEALEERLNNALLPRLNELEGLKEAVVYGLPQKHWLISIYGEKLKSLGIGIDDVSRAFQNTKYAADLGMVAYDGQRLPLKVTSNNEGIQELEKFPLLTTGERILYFGEIASFSLENSPARSYYRMNGYETLSMVLIPDERADQVTLAARIRELIAQSELVKDGAVQFILQKDDSKFIKEEVSKMTGRAALTLAILFVFVFLVTWSLRYLLIVVLALMANIGMAFLVYYLLGISLHLYSFAGIAVSLGIIIDNTIVMLDHLRHKKNKRVFLALLASTLTTIGSLSVIFFLSERLRMNMVDFAWVVVVNLATSLVVALYLIPALLHSISLKETGKLSRIRKKKAIIGFTQFYGRFLGLGKRLKWVFGIGALLAFGLPVYLLPDHLGNDNEEEDTALQTLYNNTLGSDFYNEYLKEPIAYSLGGSLRLFTQETPQGQYFETQKQRTHILMEAQMPIGATLAQMNEVFVMLEGYLRQFKEIDQFEASIYDPTNARVNITFKEAFENTSFPYLLKDLLTRKAIDLGSADWQVYGKGQAFDNSLRDQLGSFQVELYGYNYDRLVGYAQTLKDTLLKNPRIKEVNLVGQRTRYRKNNLQYVLREDPEKLMLNANRLNDLYYSLTETSKTAADIGEITRDDKRYPARLKINNADLKLWEMEHVPVKLTNGLQKVGSVALMNKEKVPDVITRVNQQYFILLEYDFIGSSYLGRMLLDKTLEAFTPTLPIGYTIKQNTLQLSQEEKEEQIWLIFLVVAIIYVICAVLLESLWQPVAIIFMIPISFIGVFLTFYLFELNFDQGGYAAFVLLSGLTVNAALYIINDYNQLRKKKGGALSSRRLYLKAFNAKIIPILLAILSTILGFMPYLLAGQEASFWFPLAAGTTGGLIFSLLAIYIYLPLFLIKNTNLNKRNTDETR